jgi:hypothetical protein
VAKSLPPPSLASRRAFQTAVIDGGEEGREGEEGWRRARVWALRCRPQESDTGGMVFPCFDGSIGLDTNRSFPPSSFSTRYSILRVLSLLLGHSDVLSVGIAGRSWERDGAGVDGCRSRVSVWSYMAFGVDAGREVTLLCSQTSHCLGFFLCFMVLQWCGGGGRRRSP